MIFSVRELDRGESGNTRSNDTLVKGALRPFATGSFLLCSVLSANIEDCPGR
jgi:hypothetical protein